MKPSHNLNEINNNLMKIIGLLKWIIFLLFIVFVGVSR